MILSMRASLVAQLRADAKGTLVEYPELTERGSRGE